MIYNKLIILGGKKIARTTLTQCENQSMQLIVRHHYLHIMFINYLSFLLLLLLLCAVHYHHRRVEGGMNIENTHTQRYTCSKHEQWRFNLYFCALVLCPCTRYIHVLCLLYKHQQLIHIYEYIYLYINSYIYSPTNLLKMVFRVCGIVLIKAAKGGKKSLKTCFYFFLLRAFLYSQLICQCTPHCTDDVYISSMYIIIKIGIISSNEARRSNDCSRV